MAQVKITKLVAGEMLVTGGGCQAIGISNVSDADCNIVDHFGNTSILEAWAGIDLPEIVGSSYPPLTINALTGKVLIIEIR